MIPYIETHITEACNLKCKGCSHFSVFAKPKHKDIQEFDREFERLADIEFIPIIRLMGGEPLLNPDFMEYLRIARKHFSYSRIALVTNGLLLKRLVPYRDEIIDLNIDVTMSNYHFQDTSLLGSFPFRELHEKGSLYNISLDLEGKQDKDWAFANCDLHQNRWYFFQDGRMYPCCIAGTIHDFWDYFGLDWNIKPEDISINIFEHTAEEIEEFITRPCELCRYCDTIARRRSYGPFAVSEGKIEEWTI